MKKSLLSPCLAALLVAHLPWQSAQALTGTWTGAGGATWDINATNWTGVSGTPWDGTNGPTNTTLFSAAATPTVSGTVYVNTITIDAVTTITGGTITLAGSSPTINGSSTGTNIIYSSLAGTNGLTKSGTGTVYLDPGAGFSTNTYTGATSVNLGTLALVGGSQASPITVSSGAALGFTLGSPTTSSSTVTFSGATAKVSVTGP